MWNKFSKLQKILFTATAVIAAVCILMIILNLIPDKKADPVAGDTQTQVTTDNTPDTGNNQDKTDGDGNEKTQESDTSVDNIPSELLDHAFIAPKYLGKCTDLKGKLLFALFFVDDSESSWSEADRKEMKKEIQEQINAVKSEAEGFGVSLETKETYYNASVSMDVAECSSNYEWINAAVADAGLEGIAGVQNKLEEEHKVDNAAIVLLLNRDGRASAKKSKTDANDYEYFILYNDVDSFCHELYHCFGATDFYYPDEVTSLANEYLPDSIMMNSREGKVDDLTAFVLGWKDSLSKKAIEFLYKTDHLTLEDLNEAIKAETFTGDVESYRYGDVGYYTGYLEDGIPNGYGKLVYDSGNVYEGEWSYGSYNGKGTYKWSSGDSYSGDYREGKCHGEGTYIFSNGDVYTGSWVSGVKHGIGTYTWASGSSYVGEWNMGKRTGEGIFTWASGNVYSGSWVDGKRHGFGKLEWTSGDVYQGMWENDKRHGDGVHTYADGTVLKGKWENDEYVG